MNNIVELKHALDVVNCKTLPSVFDALYQINLHIGEYKYSARSNDFNGWLKCDGRALSRADYPGLFDVLGTSFGSNDGLTFNLPDMRGRVLGCVGQGTGLTNRALGTMVGAETHALTSNEMPSHTHTATASNAGAHTHTINDPGHTHTQTTINDDFNNSGATPPGFSADSAGSITWSNISTSTTGITINSAGTHTHDITVLSTGGEQPHNNMQPTAFAANVFIFAGYTPAQIISH